MNREIKIIVNSLLAFIFTLLIATCASRPQSVGLSGTAQRPGAFRSNGERIYFTFTSDRGTNILKDRLERLKVAIAVPVSRDF